MYDLALSLFGATALIAAALIMRGHPERVARRLDLRGIRRVAVAALMLMCLTALTKAIGDWADSRWLQGASLLVFWPIMMIVGLTMPLVPLYRRGSERHGTPRLPSPPGR